MTSHELSAEELDGVERLVEAASAGPWFSHVVGRDTEAVSTCIELGFCNELGSFESMRLVGGTVADQDFIAGARQYLPRLLREVRVLRARLESLYAAQENLAPIRHMRDGQFLRIANREPGTP